MGIHVYCLVYAQKSELLIPSTWFVWNLHPSGLALNNLESSLYVALYKQAKRSCLAVTVTVASSLPTFTSSSDWLMHLTVLGLE